MAPEPIETGRLIVQYRAGASGQDRARVREAIGARLVGPVALADAELLDPAGGLTAARAALRGRPVVLSVTPEYRRSLFADPTDEPLFGQQWALHNTGQKVGDFVGVQDVDMNVPQAWEVTTGASDVVVAVIDDGVDFSHPDLAASAWKNPGEIAGNGVDDDGNGHVDDVSGWDFCNDDATVHDASESHGTHVAGTIAASNNGTGVVGVAPGARIMALKVFRGGADEDEDCGTDGMAIDAIDYAVSHGADIINASWGGTGFSAPLYAALAAASQQLVVAAAGNSNSDNDVVPVYPASFDLPNILSVAAIHNEGHLTDFTNFGLSSVDLSAPGEDVLSTVPGGYELMSGTSMAAPHASGVAALAISAFPTRWGEGAGLREHLIRTARALPSTHWWVHYPRLLDARGAVTGAPDITRLSGADRYATSAAISRSTFVPFVPFLFIATGENFPDALAGGAMAAQTGSPLLLVRKGSIPAPILAEISRLKPYHIIVLGGTGAVADTVLNQLQGLDGDDAEPPVTDGPFRVAGADRYATAAAVPRLMDLLVEDLFPDGWGGTVYVASGGNFPDALAGGAAAGFLGGPVLLTGTNTLPSSTKAELTRLKPSKIVVLGGVAAVSEKVFTELDGYVPGPAIARFAGADRYATAAAIANRTFLSTGTVFLSSGTAFPDALSGDAAAGAFEGPMLLTTRTTLPSFTVNELGFQDPVRIFVLGGTAAVADSVVNQVKALFP